MTDKIKIQILKIRDGATVNIISVKEVQRQAFNQGFYELVDFIETNKKGYVNFILTGKAEN